MLMPSHAKIVQPYREPPPLFAAVRRRSAARRDVLATQVTLKSGGYIVINQTEALVSIDVNSGRSTREHNIEDTALKTNLEAAEEIARQLRLRDLAGLIVIDFIDMEEKRNNRSVEKKLKECLKNDRARIQVGRISPFGLMEMSRQRIRTGVLESSSIPCPHCAGTGIVRSTPSVALQVLRVDRGDADQERRATTSIVRTRMEVGALHPQPEARAPARAGDAASACTITIVADDSAHRHHDLCDRARRARTQARAQGGRHRRPDRRHGAGRNRRRRGRARDRGGDRGRRGGSAPRRASVAAREGEDEDEDEDGGNGRRRRRRRRRRGRGDRDGGAAEPAPRARRNPTRTDGEDEDEESEAAARAARGSLPRPPTSGRNGRRRRRGRRGGRGREREREPREERSRPEDEPRIETVAITEGEYAAEPIERPAAIVEEPALEPAPRFEPVASEPIA